ncbi:hypothetical protein OROMI_022840 [Orobanche minor]
MGGSGDNNLFTVVAKNIDVIAMPVVSLLYPLYCSIKAIETKSRIDDQQWLTYWVLYSFITLFELTFSKVLEWFPIWSYAKLICVCWLVLPYFNGASYVYGNFVRPFVGNPQVRMLRVRPRANVTTIVNRRRNDIPETYYVQEHHQPRDFRGIIAQPKNLDWDDREESEAVPLRGRPIYHGSHHQYY